MPDRRLFLKLAGATGLAAVGSRMAFASAPTEKRLVVVVLRGGLDGLHAVPPYADPEYARLRPNLGLAPPGTDDGALDLDGNFGLHPALAPLHRLYREGGMLVVPAATTRYRNRSHFDGQNLLENGSGIPFGAKDGWLNRAIAGLDRSDRRLGLALGPSVPLLLQGPARVATWADSPLPRADEDFLRRLAHAYRGDPLFLPGVGGCRGQHGPPSMGGEAERGQGTGDGGGARAGQLLAQEGGPRVRGHRVPGLGYPFRTGLAARAPCSDSWSAGIVALKSGLGAHWPRHRRHGCFRVRAYRGRERQARARITAWAVSHCFWAAR